jgi:hypothetical protein
MQRDVMGQRQHEILIALAPTGVLTQIIASQRNKLNHTISDIISGVQKLLIGPVALTATIDAAALLPLRCADSDAIKTARQSLISGFRALPVSWASIAYNEDPFVRPEILAQASGTLLPQELLAIVSTAGSGIDRSAHQRLADDIALQTTPRLGPAGA